MNLDHAMHLGSPAPPSSPTCRLPARLAACALGAALATSAFAKPPAPGERLFLPPVNVASAEVAKKVVVADFDGDKRADFAVLHWEIDGRGVFEGRDVHKGYLVRVYLNRTPAPTQYPTFVLSDEYLDSSDDVRVYPMYSNDLTVADANGDGLPDLIVANAHADRVFVHPGRGDGTFAARIETATPDDPCYVAAGDFNGDRRVDLALLFVSRGFPGSNYSWKSGFMFGRGDGTFEPADPANLRDFGSFSFVGGRGPDPYYYSDGWNFALARKALRLPDGTLRDGAWMSNHELQRFDGAPALSFKGFLVNWGDVPFALFDPQQDEAAVLGGRVIVSRRNVLGDEQVSRYDGNLDGLFLDADGTSRLDAFGSGVAAADFDADGALDLALVSNELGGPGGLLARDHSAYSFLMAYGKHTLINPLTPDGAGFDVARYKEIPRAGAWRYGHRPWQIVAADFNLDEFPDLLMLTAGGIAFHPNAGLFGAQAPFPVLDDVSGLGAHAGGTAQGDPLTLFGTFEAAGFQTVTMLLRPVAAPRRTFAVRVEPDRARPGAILRGSLPPDDVLSPGDYRLSVWNGVNESSASFPVRVVLRPVQIGTPRIGRVENGQSHAPLEASGFFGRGDASDARFELVSAAGAATPLGVISLAPEKVVLRLPVTTSPGSYSLRVQHPRRGSASSAAFGVDLRPRLGEAGWLNPDGKRYNTRWFVDPPLHGGAVMEIEGALLRAPDVRGWSVSRGGMLLKEGTGRLVIRGGVPDANTNVISFYEFTLPADVTEGDVDLSLTTTAGLVSPPKRLKVTKAPGGGGGGGGDGRKPFFFGIEHKLTFDCATRFVNAKDQAEANVEIRKAVVIPAEYVFTSIEEKEAMGSDGSLFACDFQWVYDLLNADGSLRETATLEAVSREIADAKARQRAPAGGSFTFKSGPKKTP